MVVAQKGTYQTEFTTDQPNMQGNSKSTFTFSATLKNQTADQQLYALMANAPQRVECRFKPNYKTSHHFCTSRGKQYTKCKYRYYPPANVEPVAIKFRYVLLQVQPAELNSK